MGISINFPESEWKCDFPATEMQTKTLLNLREAELRVHIRDLYTGLVFLFPGYSEEGLVHTRISFHVSQFKQFLGSYADGLTELSLKWQCMSLTPCHPHWLGSVPGHPRTPGQICNPLNSEVGLVAFSSTLILQLWQAEISIIPLGAVKSRLALSKTKHISSTPLKEN